MPELVKVAKLSELKPGERKLVELDEVTVAIFTINGKSMVVRTSVPMMEGRWTTAN